MWLRGQYERLSGHWLYVSTPTLVQHHISHDIRQRGHLSLEIASDQVNLLVNPQLPIYSGLVLVTDSVEQLFQSIHRTAMNQSVMKHMSVPAAALVSQSQYCRWRFPT